MYGYSQPRDGERSKVLSVWMPKKPKNHKPISRAASLLREKVAENVYGLMEVRFQDTRYPTESGKEKALAEEAGCSWSTIQRVLAPIKKKPSENFAKIDTLADIAVVFGVSAADLLTPNFASDYRISKTPRKEVEQDELQRRSGT